WQVVLSPIQKSVSAIMNRRDRGIGAARVDAITSGSAAIAGCGAGIHSETGWKLNEVRYERSVAGRREIVICRQTDRHTVFSPVDEIIAGVWCGQKIDCSSIWDCARAGDCS